jgi:hypothetical protein
MSDISLFFPLSPLLFMYFFFSSNTVAGWLFFYVLVHEPGQGRLRAGFFLAAKKSEW